MTPESHPESHASINADDIVDVALHHEIKYRAYELYERQHDTADGHDLKDKLQAELPRVVYAAAQLQKYSNGEGRGNQSRESGSGLLACSELLYR
jgi:predicted RNase H-related nuclease YkuK (DUF458 family)